MEVGEASLDALLEIALAHSGAKSPHDALVVVLHSSLLSSGFFCASLGDGVCFDMDGPFSPVFQAVISCIHHCRALGKG